MHRIGRVASIRIDLDTAPALVDINVFTKVDIPDVWLPDQRLVDGAASLESDDTSRRGLA